MKILNISGNVILATSDANSCDADLRDAVTAVAQRLDGYTFLLIGDIVHAGCHKLSIANYRAHVAKNYPNTLKASETYAILNYLESRNNPMQPKGSSEHVKS